MFTISELLEATKGELICGSKNVSVAGVSTDSRSVGELELFIAIKGDNFDGHDFIGKAIAKGAKAIMISGLNSQIVKKKNLSVIKVKDTVIALGDIARFHRKRFNIPIVAVTGSNGKTTTKEMISWVLSDKFSLLKNEGTKNNQIGVPTTLLNLSKTDKLAVLELGTNHFGEIDYLSKICLPNVAVITNIGFAHLESFGSLDGVFQEKRSLINNLKKTGIVFLNSDDKFLRKESIFKRSEPIVFSFGIKKSADFIASGIKYSKEGIEFLVQSKHKFTLKTLGRQNVYNALAAIGLARVFGMGYSQIARRLADFDFPQGRLKVIILNEATFIDDTYNANPHSLKNALDTFSAIEAKGRKIFVMGDMLELGLKSNALHRKVGESLQGYCDVFISVGKLSELAAKEASISGFNTRNIYSCETSLCARGLLFDKIAPGKGDVVLLKGSRAMAMEKILVGAHRDAPLRLNK